jgi:chromosome segregation ATPase
VDFTKLTPDQLLSAYCAASFIVGCIVVRVFSGAANDPTKTEDPRNHTIRELEADIRLVRREHADAQQALEEKTQEFQTAVETLQSLRVSMAEIESEREGLREENKSSVSKIRELRLELQERATQSVREHLRAEDAETELQVARAGSDAVMSEINRLQEERETLTNTMRNLEEQVVLESDAEVTLEAFDTSRP